MGESTRDVIAIGNAIVDVLAHVEEQDIERLKLHKGAMTLVDGARAKYLYENMGPAIETSGGSAANTAASIASFGGKAAFIGKVRNDQLGGIFRHDIAAIGVDFPTEPSTIGSPTARCLIFVTPDAQRTMNTFLGACVELTPEDVDGKTIGSAKITYLEGYLWDPPRAKEAFVKAARLAHEQGRKVALTLSDPFCVDRHRDSFLDLIHGHVDILFANEEEIRHLFKVADFDSAVSQIEGLVEVAALTRSAKGSHILSGDTHYVIEARPLVAVIDTTGAGDAYAAGFLYAWCRDMALDRCAAYGGLAAWEAISHLGPRPRRRLATLAATHLE